MQRQIILIVLSLLFIPTIIQAQTPLPVYSFATERQSLEWYREQVKLWNNEIKKDSKNAFAWLSYYKANRNLIRLDSTDKRTHEDKVAFQKKIIDDMEKAVPESFEFNLCKWMIGGNDNQYLPYLKKAAQLGPNRIEIISDMINWGETDRNIDMRNTYAKRWYESKLASPGLLNYNYNVITGLKPNAILLTVGDNDTYPIWQLQSQGIRTDVYVLNLSLLNIDTYRDKIFKELIIEKWDTSLHKGNSINDYNPYIKEIIKQIAGNGKHYPVYVALTAGETYTLPVEEQLYLVGLAYEYSEKPIDNMALLKKNFEKNYALDYLEHAFYNDISAYYTTCLNENYLVPMLKLYDHYKASGETQNAEWIKHKIAVLAEKSEDKVAILKLIK